MCTIDRNVLTTISYVWRFVIIENHVFQHCKTLAFHCSFLPQFPARQYCATFSVDAETLRNTHVFSVIASRCVAIMHYRIEIDIYIALRSENSKGWGNLYTLNSTYVLAQFIKCSFVHYFWWSSRKQGPHTMHLRNLKHWYLTGHIKIKRLIFILISTKVTRKIKTRSLQNAADTFTCSGYPQKL